MIGAMREFQSVASESHLLTAANRYADVADKKLLLAMLSLMSIGLIMVASASMSYAEHSYGNAFYFVQRHLIYLLLASLSFVAAYMAPTHFWYRHGISLLFGVVVLLVLVLMPGIGREVNGSRRWINLGLFSLQVSELAKLAIVIFMAGYLQRQQHLLREKWQALALPLGIAGLLAGLLIIQPDFGSVVVLIGTVMGMLFIAGVKLWQFLLLGAIGGCGLASLAVLSPYRMQRLVTFLDPWADQYDSGYQLTQSLIAFGRGEWFGVGLGKSVQKMFYLPEAHTDFVFAIFAEEFGLLGVLVVVGLFVLLVARMIRLSRMAIRQQDWFTGYCCFGFSILIAGQAFINIGVTSGLLPTKGLTLPFISYGGSSLLVCSAMMGIVFRISGELESNAISRARSTTSAIPVRNGEANG